MTTYAHCKQCGGLLEDDGTCSCGYGKRKASIAAGPLLCSWTDQGRQCPCRAVFIVGRAYCREHYDVLQGVKPGGRGNYPAKSVRSAHMKRWDGWYPEWLKRRDRPIPKPDFLNQREPGSDEEELRESLNALVPEEAGQG